MSFSDDADLIKVPLLIIFVFFPFFLPFRLFLSSERHFFAFFEPKNSNFFDYVNYFNYTISCITCFLLKSGYII